jgi:hypothetical protein
VSTAADEDVRGRVRSATFDVVFAVREFRPLFGTYLLSTVGTRDHIAVGAGIGRPSEP